MSEDGEAYPAAVVAELLDAAKAMLQGGAHDGPCDNEDDPYDSCERHVAAADRRKRRLAAAVNSFEASA